MAKLWLGKVRALFHFILSLRIDMKKRVYRNFDTPSPSLYYLLPIWFSFAQALGRRPARSLPSRCQ